MNVTIKMHTVCMVKQGNRVLLLNRLHDPIIQGYIAPGGKIEFPESPSAGAIREVKEETGLQVKGLVYKGLHQFVNEEKGEWYLIYNYLAEEFDGELRDSAEGALEWVPIEEVPKMKALPSFTRRFPLFFEPGTFEINTRWDESGFEESIIRT